MMLLEELQLLGCEASSRQEPSFQQLSLLTAYELWVQARSPRLSFWQET